MNTKNIAPTAKKQRFELIPPRAVMELTKLYGRGAKKYPPNNSRLGYETSKSFGAAQRNAILFWSGEDINTETECHHISSVAWHCFAILESNLTHPEFDDRPYGAAHLAAGRDTTEQPQLFVAPAPKTLPTEYRHDLMPVYPFTAVAEVFSAKPELAIFDDEVTYGRFYGLMQDHLTRYWAGEDTEAEFGLPNLAWAAAYALLLVELSVRRPETDDRYLIDAPVAFGALSITSPASASDGVAPVSRNATSSIQEGSLDRSIAGGPAVDRTEKRPSEQDIGSIVHLRVSIELIEPALHTPQSTDNDEKIEGAASSPEAGSTAQCGSSSAVEAGVAGAAHKSSIVNANGVFAEGLDKLSERGSKRGLYLTETPSGTGSSIGRDASEEAFLRFVSPRGLPERPEERPALLSSYHGTTYGVADDDEY